MITVGIGMIVFGAIVFAAVLGVALWAVHVQDGQFPKGARTGWNAGRRGAASWFATKFTWLSGGRG